VYVRLDGLPMEPKGHGRGAQGEEKRGEQIPRRHNRAVGMIARLCQAPRVLHGGMSCNRSFKDGMLAEPY